MTGGSRRYSIDTSSLIEWWTEKYSPDVFEGLPAKVAGLIEEGRLVASRSVKDEIADDPNSDDLTLAKWCRLQTGFYHEDIEDVQITVSEIMQAVDHYPCKPGKGISGADPFVIARAEFNGDDWCVVSAERPSNGSEFNPNIPFICNSRNIEHIDFYELMKRESWKFN